MAIAGTRSSGGLWPYPRYDSIFPDHTHPIRDDDMAEAQKSTGVYIAGAPRPDLGEPTLDESACKDLDETRRLLYMALVVKRTKKYNLAGTLANAIKHHQGIDIDTNELLDYVVDAVEGGDTTWVRGQIDRICERLGN